MDKLILIIIGVLLLFLINYFIKKNNNKFDEVVDLDNNEDIFANKEVKVTSDQAKKIIAEEKGLLILDTRTQEEFNAGHIEGAILIPYNKLARRLDKLDGYEDKPILVYCRTGSRSVVAVNILIDNGFNKIYHMSRGYSKWK